MSSHPPRFARRRLGRRGGSGRGANRARICASCRSSRSTAKTARDFDDAVYAEPHPDGFPADRRDRGCQSLRAAGTALDNEARERGTSVYFPTRVMPMLPHALSDHLCSLAPHVDRLCFAADMVVTQARGAEVGALLSGGDALGGAADVHAGERGACSRDARRARQNSGRSWTETAACWSTCIARCYKARSRRGALDFDAAEAEFVIDSAERVRAIELRARNDAHRLIEECMILANVAVAQELERTRTPTLYRVHGQPEEQKLERLHATLHALGIDAQIPETSHDARSAGDHQAPRPLRGAAVHRIADRALDAAGGLSADEHRPLRPGAHALRAFHLADPALSGPRGSPHAEGAASAHAAERPCGTTATSWQALGESTSKLEKRADEADRYVATFLKCTYLRERIGQTFHGLITTVVEFGCFVQILDVAVDGLLHIDNLRDDEYEMEDDGHAWRGQSNGRRLRTGAHDQSHRDGGESDRRAHRPGAGRDDDRGADELDEADRRPCYGLHAVRVDAAAAPGARRAVRLAERGTIRGREIEDAGPQARRGPVERIDAQRAASSMSGDVAHQGVVAEIEPLAALVARTTCSPRSQSAQQPADAGAGRRAGSAQPGRVSAHRGCLRRAGGGRAADRAAQLNATVRKVAAGAAETTPVVAVTNLVRTLKLLKEAGLWVVGADAEAPKLAHEVDLKGGIVLVLGAEGPGCAS